MILTSPPPTHPCPSPSAKRTREGFSLQRVVQTAAAIAVATFTLCGCPATSASDGETTRGGAADAGSFATPPGITGLDANPNDGFAPTQGLNCFPSAGTALCGDPICESLRSCCPGNGDCCEPLTDGGLEDMIDLDPCRGRSDLTTCFASRGIAVSRLSTRAGPLVDAAGRFHGGGDALSEDGLLFETPVDLVHHRAKIAATFYPPATCDDACVDSAGIAMVEGPEQQAGAIAPVKPLAGLVLAAGREEVQVVVADRVVARATGLTSAERWTLELLPSGQIRALREGTLIYEGPFPRHPRAYLAMYGRSGNPTAMTGASVGEVTVDRAQCDMPATWESTGPLELVRAGLGALSVPVGAAAILRRSGENDVLAFEQDGEIWLADGDGSGRFISRELALVSRSDLEREDLGLRATEPAWLNLPSEPEVWFSLVVAGDGTAALGRIGVAAGSVPSLAVDPASVGVRSLAGPAPAVHSTGEQVVIARAQTTTRTSLIVLRKTPGASDFRPQDPWHLEDLTDASRRGPLTFGANAIGRPALVLHGGAWRLWVAGRRGTRWEIAALASDDLVSWRWLSEGEPVFQGGTEDHSRLGARAPDLVVGSGILEMTYLGWDGAQATLATARRPTAMQGAR